MAKKKDLIKTYDSVSLASMDLLREIVKTRSGRSFTWPNEGEFVGDGWKFSAECKDFQPLWIDPTNAKLLVDVHDKLGKEENQQKFQGMVADDRGTFGFLVEESWKLVTR